MEIKEAIKIIKRLIESVELVYKSNPLTDKEPHPETEALTIAISALKFKGNYDKFVEHVKAEGMRGREVEVRHSGRVFRVREVAQ